MKYFPNIEFLFKKLIYLVIAQANHLEVISNPKEEIQNKINQSHLNNEEIQLLKNLLVRNKDLFFIEGDNLTFTHEITHEIKTKNENPIYCKMYRYPQIHEKCKIDRQDT